MQPLSSDPSEKAGSLARSTAIMSVGTVLSRLTGVVRLAVMAAALGIAETRLTDTYNLANTAPNILYELVLGGTIGAVFIPLFVEALEKEDDRTAWETINAIFGFVMVVLAVITAIAMFAAPLIAHFYSSRLGGTLGDEQAYAVTFLLRLFLPQVLLYGVYSILSAVINAHRRFGPPMYTPIVNNFVAIGTFVLFAILYDNVELATTTTGQLLLLGIGTTLSVAPGALLLIPYARRLGPIGLRFDTSHPALRKLMRLSVYVIGFVAVNQIGYIVIQYLANEQQGGYSAYISASTFFLLPVGLFVWTLTTALLPSLSGHAINERWADYRAQFSVGARALLFLMLPAAVGLLLLARPLVTILLEHGVVTARSSDLVAEVLQFFVLGLVQFALFQLLVRAFYALHDTKTPFWVNFVVIALNTAINVPMFEWLGVKGLAAGQAISYSLGVGLLGWLLAARVDGIEARRIATSALRITTATAGMGIVVWLVAEVTDPSTAAGWIAEAWAVAAPVAAGLAAFLALARLFRVEELIFVRSLLGQRFSRGPVDEVVG